jgi:hypothetical protein
VTNWLQGLDDETIGKELEKEEFMFCYQCEQTAKGEGCTKIGVCGKEPEIAALQDLLVYSLIGLSQYAVEGRKAGVNERDINVFTVQAAFSTLTNVDFDPDRFVALINEAVEKREQLKDKVKAMTSFSRVRLWEYNHIPVPIQISFPSNTSCCSASKVSAPMRTTPRFSGRKMTRFMVSSTRVWPPSRGRNWVLKNGLAWS